MYNPYSQSSSLGVPTAGTYDPYHAQQVQTQPGSGHKPTASVSSTLSSLPPPPRSTRRHPSPVSRFQPNGSTNGAHGWLGPAGLSGRGYGAAGLVPGYADQRRPSAPATVNYASQRLNNDTLDYSRPPRLPPTQPLDPLLSNLHTNMSAGDYSDVLYPVLSPSDSTQNPPSPPPGRSSLEWSLSRHNANLPQWIDPNPAAQMSKKPPFPVGQRQYGSLPSPTQSYNEARESITSSISEMAFAPAPSLPPVRNSMIADEYEDDEDQRPPTNSSKANKFFGFPAAPPPPQPRLGTPNSFSAAPNPADSKWTTIDGHRPTNVPIQSGIEQLWGNSKAGKMLGFIPIGAPSAAAVDGSKAKKKKKGKEEPAYVYSSTQLFGPAPSPSGNGGGGATGAKMIVGGAPLKVKRSRGPVDPFASDEDTEKEAYDTPGRPSRDTERRQKTSTLSEGDDNVEQSAQWRDSTYSFMDLTSPSLSPPMVPMVPAHSILSAIDSSPSTPTAATIFPPSANIVLSSTAAFTRRDPDRESVMTVQSNDSGIPTFGVQRAESIVRTQGMKLDEWKEFVKGVTEVEAKLNPCRTTHYEDQYSGNQGRDSALFTQQPIESQHQSKSPHAAPQRPRADSTHSNLQYHDQRDQRRISVAPSSPRTTAPLSQTRAEVHATAESNEPSSLNSMPKEERTAMIRKKRKIGRALGSDASVAAVLATSDREDDANRRHAERYSFYSGHEGLVPSDRQRQGSGDSRISAASTKLSQAERLGSPTSFMELSDEEVQGTHQRRRSSGSSSSSFSWAPMPSPSSKPDELQLWQRRRESGFLGPSGGLDLGLDLAMGFDTGPRLGSSSARDSGYTVRDPIRDSSSTIRDGDARGEEVATPRERRHYEALTGRADGGSTPVLGGPATLQRPMQNPFAPSPTITSSTNIDPFSSVNSLRPPPRKVEGSPSLVNRPHSSYSSKILPRTPVPPRSPTPPSPKTAVRTLKSKPSFLTSMALELQLATDQSVEGRKAYRRIEEDREKKKRKDRLAKVHQFLGSHVPAELVLGTPSPSTADFPMRSFDVQIRQGDVWKEDKGYRKNASSLTPAAISKDDLYAPMEGHGAGRQRERPFQSFAAADSGSRDSTPDIKRKRRSSSTAAYRAWQGVGNTSSSPSIPPPSPMIPVSASGLASRSATPTFGGLFSTGKKHKVPAELSPEESEMRRKDELTERERMVQVKRAHKIEQVFGEQPPSSLYRNGAPIQTAPQPLPPPRSSPFPGIPKRAFMGPFSSSSNTPLEGRSSTPESARSNTGLMSAYHREVEKGHTIHDDPAGSILDIRPSFETTRSHSIDGAWDLPVKTRGEAEDQLSIVGYRDRLRATPSRPSTSSAPQDVHEGRANDSYTGNEKGKRRSKHFLHYRNSLKSLLHILDMGDEDSLAELYAVLNATSPAGSDTEIELQNHQKLQYMDDLDQFRNKKSGARKSRSTGSSSSLRRRASLSSFSPMSPPNEDSLFDLNSMGAGMVLGSRTSKRYSAARFSTITRKSSIATLRIEPEPMSFQARRRRAQKLTNFFGTSYRDLFSDVLEKLEASVKEEVRDGSISLEEMKDLMGDIDRLKKKKAAFR